LPLPSSRRGGKRGKKKKRGGKNKKLNDVGPGLAQSFYKTLRKKRGKRTGTEAYFSSRGREEKEERTKAECTPSLQYSFPTQEGKKEERREKKEK